MPTEREMNIANHIMNGVDKMQEGATLIIIQNDFRDLTDSISKALSNYKQELAKVALTGYTREKVDKDSYTDTAWSPERIACAIKTYGEER